MRATTQGKAGIRWQGAVLFFLILRKVTRGPVAYRSGVYLTQAVLLLCFYMVGEPLSRHCFFLIARASLCCQRSHRSHCRHLRLSLMLLHKAAACLLVLCFSPLSEALCGVFPYSGALGRERVSLYEGGQLCVRLAGCGSVYQRFSRRQLQVVCFFPVIFFFFVCLTIFPHQYFRFLTLIKFILNLYSMYLDPDSGF